MQQTQSREKIDWRSVLQCVTFALYMFVLAVGADKLTMRLGENAFAHSLGLNHDPMGWGIAVVILNIVATLFLSRVKTKRTLKRLQWIVVATASVAIVYASAQQVHMTAYHNALR